MAAKVPMIGGEVDHEELKRIVGVIDEDGTRLNRDEINFIAGLIDGDVHTFSNGDAVLIMKIYDKRVVNGKPDREL